MNKILVTGSNGQLGSEIKELSKSVKANFFFDILDITDQDALKSFIKRNEIDTIINCAAYTAVDKAQDDEASANRVNHLAVKYLAELSKENGIKLIHISTDYVFDGKSCKPYKEDDKTNPITVYGKTKLKGEKALQEVAPKNSIIIRTSWVYSSFGNNIVKSMLRYGREKDELRVVYDQVGAPTYARDLAKMILDIMAKIKNDEVEIYHYSNEGVLSWYDFAKEIMKMARIECDVEPIESFEYPLPASRPHYSILNKAKIKKEFEIKVPFWKDSLSECLIKMREKQ